MPMDADLLDDIRQVLAALDPRLTPSLRLPRHVRAQVDALAARLWRVRATTVFQSPTTRPAGSTFIALSNDRFEIGGQRVRLTSTGAAVLWSAVDSPGEPAALPIRTQASYVGGRLALRPLPTRTRRDWARDFAKVRQRISELDPGLAAALSRVELQVIGSRLVAVFTPGPLPIQTRRTSPVPRL